MKIPLNMGNNATQSSRQAQAKHVERDVLAAKGGDWNAKSNLARTFMPLLQTRAQKRSNDTAEVNTLIERGKEGLFKACRKYNAKKVGAAHFQTFALDFIEKAMDRKPGLLTRLFGSR